MLAAWHNNVTVRLLHAGWKYLDKKGAESSPLYVSPFHWFYVIISSAEGVTYNIYHICFQLIHCSRVSLELIYTCSLLGAKDCNNYSEWEIRPYQWSATSVGVFLVEVLLKLWKLTEVPVLFSQPFSWVAKLSWRGSTLAAAASSSTKARGSTIPKQTEKHTFPNAQQEMLHRSVILDLYMLRTAIKSSFL